MSPNFVRHNINTLWAGLIIEELRRCGVETFCVAPGSRSAPLAVAVASNPKVNSVIHYDERGLGFFALGLTSALAKPTGIITTSGSAVANLFPSIIEASKKKLPLIVITADRPPELRSTGANQTIDQVKIFGDYVRYFFDMPCPTIDIPPEMVLTSIDQLISRAFGELSGPVHLNCMFREPLSPQENKKNYVAYRRSVAVWEKYNKPYTVYSKAKTHLANEILDHTAQILNSIKNGIIAVGKLNGPQDARLVLNLARKLNWPIFADMTSGLRLGHRNNLLIHHFDHLLAAKRLHNASKIDGIIQLGGRLTSQHWLNYLRDFPPQHYLMVLNHPLRNDPQHRVTVRIQSGIADFCQSLLPKVTQKGLSRNLQILRKADQVCAKTISGVLESEKTLSEPSLAYCLTKLIPENTGLFIGNSLPIRDINHFASCRGHAVRISANRGASGIDGNIATAAGFANGIANACSTIIGDLTFLYDLNSLSILRDMEKPFVLIIVNNNGGGIFDFLPIAQLKDHFKHYFTVPQNMNYQHAAHLFSLGYHIVRTKDEFEAHYPKAIRNPGTTIIEVICDSKQSHLTKHLIHSRIKQNLAV